MNYREFLIAGIFAQTVVFGATFTGAGLAEDIQKGIIDRFRSLPMARSAVLVGRTTSDVVYNVISIAIMALTGLLVGWRIRGSFLEAVAGFAAAAAVRLRVLVGDGVGGPARAEPRGRQQRLVHRDLPAHVHRQHVRAASRTCRPVLRTFAEWNPVSAVTQAARDLFGNTNPAAPPPDVWPLQNPELYTLIWVAIILAVFVPLSNRQYRKATSR